MTTPLIDRLKKRLIVSSQAMNPRSPLKRPDVLALMAEAAELEGAGGFRLELQKLGVPVVVEGGIWTPEHVAESFAAGALAVVCGSAITAPDIITSRLVAAIPA